LTFSYTEINKVLTCFGFLRLARSPIGEFPDKSTNSQGGDKSKTGVNSLLENGRIGVEKIAGLLLGCALTRFLKKASD
jgi:hypothetical protein